MVSWCFGAAFLSAGAIATILGPRGLFVLAGAGTLAAWAFATVALRTAWTGIPRIEPAAAASSAVPTPAEAFFGLGAAGVARENA
jgi:hypothetical protein